MNFIDKKHKSLRKHKILSNINEVLKGSGSAISTSTMSLTYRSIGTALTSSTALLTSFGIIIADEHTSNLKTRYTQVRD